MPTVRTVHSGTGAVVVVVVEGVVVVEVSAAVVDAAGAAVLVVDIGANVVATVVSPEADWHPAASSATPMRMLIGRNEVIGQRCYGPRLLKRCIVECTQHPGTRTTFRPGVEGAVGTAERIGRQMRSRHERILDMAERRLSLGVETGIIHRRIEDESLSGATITIDGRPLTNFSSCAYLALNRDERLKAAAIDATRRYGTSYSSSPTYTALPLYDTLEEHLRQITGGSVAVAQTTTLAHLAALPIMVGPEDLVLVDAQTHDSVHLAARALRGVGARVTSVPHNDVVAVEQHLDTAAARFRQVWYLADGVYSMYGDLAPVKEIAALQQRFGNLFTYYDDAHGFGWLGEHGRGYVLAETPINERMVVAAGFAKSFGSVGAVLVFGDPAAARRVRLVGGPLTFSGPITPPDLGAATESARIHLTAEHAERQERFCADIDWVRAEIVRRGLPVVSMAKTPIWFVRVGSPERVAEMISRLIADGFYLNAAAFPAVPVGEGGIRWAQTLHHSREDLAALMDAIERHLPEVLGKPDIVVDLRGEVDSLVGKADPAER